MTEKNPDLARRYERNRQTLSEADQARLAGSRVLVAGCGGLGGYVLEALVRIGVETLTAADGDCFDATNLNRQILSAEDNLGCPKAAAAQARAARINSAVTVRTVGVFLDEENAGPLIRGHHLVMDALDSADARLLLEDACRRENIPLVHGAIGGWYGQVTVVMPGDDTLHALYGGHAGEGEEKILGNPAFIPPVVAGIQVAEGIKLLLGRKSELRGRLLTVDLLHSQFEMLQL